MLSTANAQDSSTGPLGNTENSVKGQGAQAVVVQNYCLAVRSMPDVNFAGHEKLVAIGSEMNQNMRRMRGNADRYLDVLLPRSVATIQEIGDYFELKQAVIESVTSGELDKTELLNTLYASKETVQEYKKNASNLATDFAGLRTNIANDSKDMKGSRNKLITITQGDKGIIKSLDGQIDQLSTNIGYAIGGAALSAVAVIGGGFLVAVGTVSSFVTAGTSAPIAITGGALVVAGVGGAVASGIALSNMIKKKNELVSQRAQIKEEVKIATLQIDSINQMINKADNAVNATQQMVNAWAFLQHDLEDYIKDVERGQWLPTVYFRKVATDVNKIITDVDTIKKQLTGVTVISEPNRNLSEIVKETAEKQAA
ncbi:HBL/NHE enterotoxin family protein [Magnetococcales bacterium HHB-1]